MTTLTNSEGLVINYTNEFLDTILLQLNASNNYYTTGNDNIIFIKIGSNKILLLDYTYHINRNIFQYYTINENVLIPFKLEYSLNNGSNEYTIHQVYIANSYIGTITELSHVFLAMYDSEVIIKDYYTKSEIDELDNELSNMILNTYTKTETDNLLDNINISDKQDTITALTHLEFKSLDLSGNLLIDWDNVTYGLDVVCNRNGGFAEIARFKSTGDWHWCIFSIFYSTIKLLVVCRYERQQYEF